MDQVPKKLGKYEVAKEIGRGSMGVVFEAFDPFIERPVAIKVALADALRDADTGERFRKMFFNEAHTAGMLRHPNILDIFDAGVDGDLCFIVMELVENGGTLRNYCRPENLLPLPEAAEIVFKCAKALDYAHRQGVIHRDIKPTNILLDRNRDVKIADFSIAHINRTDMSQTMPMGFVGSPRYMSPEQVQEDTITNQTDLFSLGVVAFELITGRHPFGGDSFSALIHRVINEPPVDMASYRPDVPPALKKVVERALEKTTERRYRMGLELASDLSALFSHLDRPQVDIPMQEKFLAVKEIDFFRGFTDSEIWEIIRASVWQEANQDEAVIKEGETGDFFFIITAGRMRVTKFGHELGRLGIGDCFGEMGYLSKSKRSASVIAEVPVSLMKINATLLEQVSAECKLRFYQVFLKVMVERLQKTSEKLARGGG